MSNQNTEPTTSEDFDLFATPVDNHLAEELAKGTFAWTNKYTKILGVLTIAVGLLSVGAWYGHHTASTSTSTNFSALRSAFTRSGANGGFGGGSGSGTTGGSGGGGFGTRVTGTIASVSGATVTITLNDPTQASSLKTGDTARVTDTAGAGGAPSLPSASSSAGTTGSTPSVGGATAKPGTARTPRSSGASAAPRAAGAAGTAGGTSGTQGGPRGGGLFSNPAFTACLTKAGVTITPGQRPNFQDSATAAAIQSCMKSLGITFGGGAGGAGGGGFGPGAGAPAGSGATSTTP